MKICILRRDGENVHNGMAEVMFTITEKYFGRKELFNEAGINIEDKNYTNEEVESLKMRVTDFIMSQSSKYINKYNQKFSNIL